MVLLAAGHQTLLREVGDICGKDGEDTADEAVGAHHLHTLLSGGDEGLEQEGHALVEQTVTRQRTSVFREARKLRNGQVPN